MVVAEGLEKCDETVDGGINQKCFTGSEKRRAYAMVKESTGLTGEILRCPKGQHGS